MSLDKDIVLSILDVIYEELPSERETPSSRIIFFLLKLPDIVSTQPLKSTAFIHISAMSRSIFALTGLKSEEAKNNGIKNFFKVRKIFLQY